MTEYGVAVFITTVSSVVAGWVFYLRKKRKVLGTVCTTAFGGLMMEVAIEHYLHGKPARTIAKGKGIPLQVVRTAIETYVWAIRAQTVIEQGCRPAANDASQIQSGGTTEKVRRRGRRRSA